MENIPAGYVRIPFTQYLRPGGRREESETHRPKEIADLARAVLEKGGRFTCEVLMTGQVSVACEAYDPEIEEVADVAIEVIENHPDKIGPGVDAMIKAAYEYVLRRCLECKGDLIPAEGGGLYCTRCSAVDG